MECFVGNISDRPCETICNRPKICGLTSGAESTPDGQLINEPALVQVLAAAKALTQRKET